MHFDWEDIRYFLRLAEIGTLSGAARSLNVNHATVSRRLDRLETDLGITLFDRRADGYHLTADGSIVHARAVAMRDNADAIASRADEERGMTGVVRLTMTRSLADFFVAPRLAPLLAQHPGIGIDLITESRNMSLARREADIALRLARPSDGDMIGRRIGLIVHGFYTARTGSLDAGTVAEPRFIAYSSDMDTIPEAEWLYSHLSVDRIIFRSNSLGSQLAAAEAGIGIALLPHFLARQSTGLCPIDLGITPPTREVWLLIRRDLARIARLRVVIDYLVGLFGENRALLEHPPDTAEPNAGAGPPT